MPFSSHPVAFARTACSASSLRRYVAVSTVAAAAQPKTKPLIHSVARRFSRLLFACAPLLLGAAALVPAAPAQAQVVDICDRTAEVETAILAELSHNDCSAVTSTELDGIGGTLALNSASIASLQAGDFSGLSSLTILHLHNNALTSLPAGIFSDLESLTELRLHNNQLASLPSDIFNTLYSLTSLNLSGNALTSLPPSTFDLYTLTSLNLSSNALTSLPPDIFNYLDSLTSLDFSGNPGDPFTLTFTATLSQIEGDVNVVRVQMSASAWATLAVPLAAENGTLSASSVTIPVGGTLSNAVTLTPDSDPNTVSTVGIGTLPALPAGFTGIALAKGPSLTMMQGGICSRSPKVQAAIVTALSGVSNCGAVTAAHLASLTGTLTLGAAGATTLQAGDFAGLSQLTVLDLANLNIDSLPQDLFSELAKLTTLNLSGNSLAELPAGVFAGLSSLSSVDLSGNSGAPFTLPLVLGEDGSGRVHVYLEHGAPKTLSIPLEATGGSLSASSVSIAVGQTISESVTFTADSSGDVMTVGFGGTLPSAGTGVQLGAGEFLRLADSICARTPEVRDAILALLSHNDCGAVTRADLASIGGTLILHQRGITSLKYGDFSGLSNLQELWLYSNALTGLPAGVFSGLSNLQTLDLSANDLTSLPAGVFSGLGSLQILDLDGNALRSLPSGVFGGLSSLTHLNLDGNALTSFPSGVFSALSSLTHLNLDANALRSLPVGVFSGLSSLEDLRLSANDLTSLPVGVFSGLSSLEALWLSANDLTSLPAGVFSGLGSLKELWAHNNALRSLPAGVFSGLSNLTVLYVSDNPGAPFQLALSLEVDSAASTISVLAPLGAPEDLVIPLSISGGTVAGSANATATIATGATTSPLVTVVAEEVVTVSFGTLPALTPYSYDWEAFDASGIEGLTLVAGDPASFAPGICGHTAQVRTAIRAKLGDKACGDVSDADLAGISGTLSINSASITSLQVGDFSGLTSLEGLELRGNQLASLPTDAFSDLDSLTSLDLGGNQLASVSGSGLDGLTSLKVLRLGGNSLTSLSASLLNNLTALTELNLSGNSLTSLPTGLLTGLTSLTELNLSGNSLTSLPAGLLTGLTSLTELNLSGNGLTSLPTGLLTGLTSLTELNLSGNSLTSLPTGLLTGLTSLTDLDLSGNALTSLASGVFGDLTSLTGLKLNNNQLAALPATLLSTLTSLTELKLHNNQLSELPAGLFSGLTSLSASDLDFRANKTALVLPLVLDYQRISQSQGSLSVGLAIGAPVALSIPLQVAAGDATLSASTVTLAAGGVSSNSITVTRGADNADITLNFGTPPVLTDTGLTLGQGVSVMLSVPIFATASLSDQTLLQGTALTPVQFEEASGLDTPLVHVLSATTDDGDVDSADNLPVGLDFNASTRILSGTPTASGVYALTYTATDSDGDTATQTLNLTVVADTAPSFGGGTVARQDYKQFAAISDLILPAATGGNGTPVYSLTATTDDGTVDSADTLPEGLDFDAGTRTLSGTPTAAGTYVMTYSVSDDDGDSDSLPSFQLVVDSVPTLVNAMIGNHVHVKDRAIDDLQLPQAEGGTGTVSYSLTASTTDGTVDSADTLPTGLDFDAGTRTLSGTPTVVGTYTMTYTATDSDSDSATRTFELTVSVFVPICDRTAQVSDALVARLKSDSILSSSDGCAQVTDNMLSGLAGTLSVSNPSPKLTALAASDFSGLSNLEVLDLSDNSLTAGGLPDELFSPLTSLTGLNLGTNQLASLPATLLSPLTSLTDLDLSGNALTSLASGVFGDLTSLTGLKLNNNQLASLPATLLSALTSLSELKLHNNQLSELPAGLFSGLTSLSEGDLDFRDNKTALVLPMVLDYQRISQSQGSLSVGLAIGAPVALSIPLQVAAGDATLSASTVTLAAGGVSSSSVTVTRGAGNADITLSLGTLPVLTDTGLTLGQGANVILSVPVFATASLPDQTLLQGTALTPVQFEEASGLDTPLVHVLSATTDDGTVDSADNLPVGLDFNASTRTLSGTPTAVGTYAMTYTATDSDNDSATRTFELTVAAFFLTCDRTAQVRDALVARLKSDGTLGASDGCAQVTDSMLSDLAGTLDVSDPSPKLTALLARDFSGLSNLEVLDLSENSLTASGLPANVFSSLGSLTELNLADNALSATLNAKLLAGLAALEGLSLEGNSLTASHFPSTLFDDNTGLLTLNLSGSSLSGGLPSALPATLTGLELRDSGLTGLPAGFFTKFSSLTTLDLTDNTVALTLQLHYLGNSKIQARLPEGAPWPLTVSVSGASGSSTQVSPNSISLTQGETASAELQVSGYPAIISLGSLPSVPAGHNPTGLTLATGGSLNLTVPTFSASVADSRHTAGVSLSVQLPVATSGADSIGYSLSVSTDDGTLSNNLPAGLSLNSGNRTLSGAPTAAGTYAVTWTATDADGDSAELTFNLVVEADSTPAFAQSVSIADQTWPLNTNITAVPFGGDSAPCTLGGDPLSPCQLPVATGGNGTLQYSLTATVAADRNGELQNGLPTGLAFAAGTRQLSGTPTVLGTYSLTYSASDKEGDAVSLSFGVVVDGMPVFSSTQDDLSLSTGVPKTALTLPTSTGGNLPLTYSLSATTADGTVDSADNLPQGLEFDPDTRLLTGTPTADGVYQLTYRVTDGNGSVSSMQFSIRVQQPQVDVCDRGAVGEAIEALVGESCSVVAVEKLQAVTSLTVVSQMDVILQPEDFAGLPALTTLDLSGVTSTTLAAKLEDGLLQQLSSLQRLSLSGVGLDRLPVESFAGLWDLRELDLSDNDLTALGGVAVSAGGGIGLDNLVPSVLEKGVFSGLSNLRKLNLSGNDLQTLPEGLLDDLYMLTDLDLSGNPGAPFEFEVDLRLEERIGGIIRVTAGFEQILPLPVDVTLEVLSDGMGGQPETLVIPATGGGDVVPLEVPDSINSVRITSLNFGPDDTGAGLYHRFASVRLVAGAALILDAHPHFDETAIADQSYVRNTPIQRWELPEARVLTPPGVSAENIALTYSLSASTDDGDLGGTASLPAGLAFDAGTRTLTGIPKALGTYRMTYSVVEDDGDRASLQFAVTVGGGEALYRQLHGQILSQYALTIATDAGRAVAERVDRLAQGQEPRFATNADGSEFEIPLSSQGGSWSLWRRDSGNDLSWRSPSAWSWDGNITSWQMGADRHASDSTWLAGFMVQNAEGEFDYSGGSGLPANLSGDYAVPVRSGHLYAGWAPRGAKNASWVSVWGMAGFGSGRVSLGQRQAGAYLRSDADLSMSHFGVAVTPVRLSSGLRVQFRAETVQATVDLAGAMSLDASRRRTLLAVLSPNLLGGGNQLLLSGEFGFRTDDSGVDESGDLAVGTPDGSGSELGAKLHYASKYVTVEVGARSLSVNSSGVGEAFEESGWYLSFSLTPKPGERGLALSLKPSWGNTGSGLDDLWEDEQLPGVGSVGRGAVAGKGSMDAELSYGFGLSGGGEAVLSPYSKISTAEGSAHSGAFGVRLELGKAFDLSFEHSDQYGAEAQDGRGRLRLGGTLRL